MPFLHEGSLKIYAYSPFNKETFKIREVGSGYSPRATTPETERPWSSASTYNYYSNYSTPSYNNQTSGSRPSTPQPQR